MIKQIFLTLSFPICRIRAGQSDQLDRPEARLLVRHHHLRILDGLDSPLPLGHRLKRVRGFLRSRLCCRNDHTWNFGTQMIFVNGPTMASFSFIFVFSNTHYNFPTNKCENMSIQNTVPGFELTAFGT